MIGIRAAVSVALVGGSLAAACAGARNPGRPAPRPSLAAVDAGLDGSAREAGAPLATLDELAARGERDAPQMRERLRSDDASRPIDVRAPDDRDVCLRAAFSADRPVSAAFEDEGHVPRGDAAPATTSGLVPPGGPACARRGERMRLVLDAGADATFAARAVVWQAP